MRRELLTLVLLLLPLTLGGAAEPQVTPAAPLRLQPAASDRSRAEGSQASPRIQPPAQTPAEWAALAPSPARTTAIIVGPKESAPGDLVILDASTSDAASFAWALPGSTKTLLPVDGGKRCVFATGAQGKYVFVLATAKGDAVAIAVHELVIGKPEPEPQPTPVPPTPNPLPDGKFKLAKLAFDNAAKVQTANRAAESKSMAKAFRSIVAAIAAGTMSTPKQILDGTAAAVESNLGASRDPWKAWGQLMAAEYQRLYEAKQLPTAADWRTAWEEVALGLEAIQ